MAGWLELELVSGRLGWVRRSGTLCSGGLTIQRLKTAPAPVNLPTAPEITLETALEKRRAD
jgi:hypothetical protein